MKFSKNMFGLSLLGVGVLALATYSNLSINSDDFMNDNEIRFVKRIDGLTGHTVRAVASLKPFNFFEDKAPKKFVPAAKPQSFGNLWNQAKAKIIDRGGVVAKKPGAKDPNCVEAVIKQELELSLTEVYSPKLAHAALTKENFSGALSASNGVLDAVDARITTDKGEFSFAMNNVKMCGSLFSFENNNEVSSGMIFTTDNKSYMVSITGGQFDGTRFKFDVAQSEDVGNSDTPELAENDPNQAPPEAMMGGQFAAAPMPAQPMYNANNYEQDPQAGEGFNQAPQFAQSQAMMNNPAMQAPANGEDFSQEEVEGQAMNNGFNFAPPAPQDV